MCSTQGAGGFPTIFMAGSESFEHTILMEHMIAFHLHVYNQCAFQFFEIYFLFTNFAVNHILWSPLVLRTNRIYTSNKLKKSRHELIYLHMNTLDITKS